MRSVEDVLRFFILKK